MGELLVGSRFYIPIIQSCLKFKVRFLMKHIMNAVQLMMNKTLGHTIGHPKPARCKISEKNYQPLICNRKATLKPGALGRN